VIGRAGEIVPEPSLTAIKTLADFVIDDCGDRFVMWSHEFSDGSWELHFQGPCASCQKIARALAAEVAPGKPVKVV
jgi:hypothetical protein